MSEFEQASLEQSCTELLHEVSSALHQPRHDWTFGTDISKARTCSSNSACGSAARRSRKDCRKASMAESRCAAACVVDWMMKICRELPPQISTIALSSNSMPPCLDSSRVERTRHISLGARVLLSFPTPVLSRVDQARAWHG
jgi:hypothetical protein